MSVAGGAGRGEWGNRVLFQSHNGFSRLLGIAGAVLALATGLDAVAQTVSHSPAVPTTRNVTSTAAPERPTQVSVAAEGREFNEAAREALIAALLADAKRVGVSHDTIIRVLSGIERDPDVAGFTAAQTEHERTTGQYVTLLVSPERIALGRARAKEVMPTLVEIEERFGVDRYTLAGLWGVETRYGVSTGKRSVIRALATLAMEDQRRATFWRSELLQALLIVERGDIEPEALVGSWAGAMGQTQFMPSTFNRFAIDADGDGRRDLWQSTADALGSAANYLVHSGWRRGEGWGFEVELPQGFDYALADPAKMRPLTFWQLSDVAPAGGREWPSSSLEHRLLLPAGAMGPAFLVNGNFAALLRYNPAVSYALTVAYLGDMLAGHAALLTPWPDEPGLSRSDRVELQRRLAGMGYDIGDVDGIIGSLTRAAIRSYQVSSGLAADGHPGAGLLARLRAGEADPQDGSALGVPVAGTEAGDAE